MGRPGNDGVGVRVRQYYGRKNGENNGNGRADHGGGESEGQVRTCEDFVVAAEFDVERSASALKGNADWALVRPSL